jgi:hypothetical protein
MRSKGRIKRDEEENEGRVEEKQKYQCKRHCTYFLKYAFGPLEHLPLSS